MLTHCCAATGSIVGVSEFSFGLFSYFSPPFGIYRRAFVFAKRGTDPVTKKQVLTHCCAATGSSVGVTEFSFGLFFRHLSACVRFPRASVSSLPSCVCIKSIQLHLSAVARFGLFSYFSSPSGIYRPAFVSLVRLYQVYIFPCIFRTQQRMVELARTWCTTLATRRQFAFPSCVCIKSIFFLAFFVLKSGW